ncbi:MAG: 3-phosphoshikimate 1-carboxyvinyltransferase [Clostridia bacterium]|nr:3-phosphoshikimate 1-carboxyvinyltransferase [Clostridia bacterium]
MNYKVKNIYGNTSDKKIPVSVPGSKSITARALLIAALSCGESTLYGVQFSDDCATFLQCLKDLGIKCEVFGTTVKITGCGGKLEKSKAEIYVGSAGTAARFLPAFLAFQNGRYTLTCSEQMKKRPVSSLIKTLEELGAKFTFLEEKNSYPFIIEGTLSPKTEITVNIEESSQFLSALLICGICANAPMTIKAEGRHSLGYVNMTLDMMWSFGVTAQEIEGGYRVCGGYTAKKYEIEPDVSAACYFYAANKILGTNLCVNGLMPRSMQGDIKFIKLLQDFDGGTVDCSPFSDQALTLAAIAPYFKNPTKICNVAHIRKQECDRIKAMVENLTAMGVKVEEFADGVKIYPSLPKPAKIKTFGDHRVAMSFAVSGLRADGIEIENAEVCSKTFKDFFTVLDGICNEYPDNKQA